MLRFRSLLFIITMMSLGAGCGGPEISYTLVFPHTDTFLLAANVTIDVYDNVEDSDAICRNLSVNQAPGSSPVSSTGKQDVCDFLNGGVKIDRVSTGRLVVFASVEDRAGTALMRGCRVADVYPETENIEITLSTLPTYPVDPTITCSSTAEKCEEEKDCTE